MKHVRPACSQPYNEQQLQDACLGILIWPQLDITQPCWGLACREVTCLPGPSDLVVAPTVRVILAVCLSLQGDLS